LLHGVIKSLHGVTNDYMV